MKRVLLLLVVLIAVFGITASAGAAAPPNWNVSGTWEGESGLKGVLGYGFVMTITQDANANVTGTIVYPAHSITRTVTGTVEGNDFSFITEGGGYDADCAPCTLAIDGDSFHGYGVDSGGNDVEFFATGNADLLPTGQITKPTEGESLWGLIDLEAIYNDDNPSGVQWAVRQGTCQANTNTVAGNVDGFSTPYSFDGALFMATVNASSWVPGDYCFIFNPREGAGEPNMRLTRWFVVVAPPEVHGGGQIIEEVGNKTQDWHKISFGGWFYVLGGGAFEGEWQINFHNVGVDAFDKSRFHTTNIVEANFFDGPPGGTCYDALNFTAYGSWNGTPGYKLIFRAGDFGSPGKADTARIELFAPAGPKVYDTTFSWGQEFTNESNCVGTARTGLDAGNITITAP
jgi:hypothetical protein